MPPATTAALIATAQKGEHDGQRHLRPKARPAQLHRRFEDQRRQEDVEDQLARQRQVGTDREIGKADARQHEARRIRQADPPRYHRHQRGDDQHRSQFGQSDLCHQ
jgi:hypothetical protein